MRAALFKDWVTNLKEFLSAHNGIPGFSSRDKIAPALTNEELSEACKELPLKLPDTLQKFLLEGSRACRFRYQWKLAGVAPELLESVGWTEDKIYGGLDLCDPAALPEHVKECKEWAEETWIADEEEERKTWLNSLPIAALRNGDYLAVELGDKPNPPVVYLCHEEPSQIIAPSFTAFLENWAKLCYIGPEIWILEPFLNPDTGYLDGDSEQAQALRRLFSVS